MKHILLLFVALTVGVANTLAVQTMETQPADQTNLNTVVDGSAGWNSQGGGLIPLYDGYPTVVYYNNVPFQRYACDDNGENCGYGWNWNNFIIETPELTECAGITLRADNWGWTYNNTYGSTVAPTYTSKITWSDWDLWRENSAAGNTMLIAEATNNILTFTTYFKDGNCETYTVTYPTTFASVPVDGFYLGSDGGIVEYQTISFSDPVYSYTNTIKLADSSWWTQVSLSQDQLFGLIDPHSATEIVVDFELAGQYGYNSVTGNWVAVGDAKSTEPQTFTIDAKDIDIDSTDPETGELIYYFCFAVGDYAGVAYSITWTVKGSAVNEDFVPNDPWLDPTYNAISDIKVDVDAVEVGRYNLAGQKIAGEQKGINIVVYSDGSSKKVLVK